MKYTGIIILTLTIFTINLHAQSNLKYKDVYDKIQNISKEEAFMLLKEYQRIDPLHANVYYQLGLVTEHYAFKYDPLIESRMVKYFTYEANNFLNLAKSKTDDKEVRKSKNYFENIQLSDDQRRVQLADVLHDIDLRIERIQKYQTNVEIIQNNFEQCVFHYNNCVSFFKEINEANNNLKDIYMTADEAFLEKLDNLNASFDSTLYYMELYKTSLDNYPIGNYKPRYELERIKTYRLEGLTTTNFLKNDIVLWDYGVWVREFKGVLDKDINEIRRLLAGADAAINTDLQKLETEQVYHDSLKVYRVPQALLFRTAKFDYQSSAVELLKYKQSKLDTWSQYYLKTNDPNSKKGLDDVVLMAGFYSRLVDHFKQAGVALENFKTALTEEGYKKYEQYYQEFYGSISQFGKWTTNEKDANDKKFDKALDTYKSKIINYKTQQAFADSFLLHKNDTLRLSVYDLSASNLLPGNFYPLHFDDYNEFTRYYTGVFRAADNKLAGFAALVYKQEVVWLTKLGTSGSQNSYGVRIKGMDKGCLLALHAHQENQPFKNPNRLLQIGSGGNIDQNWVINSRMLPRVIDYDDVGERILLVMHDSIDADPEQLMPVDVQLYSMKGDTLAKTESRFQLSGNIVKLVRSDDRYFIFGNYARLHDLSGNTIQNPANVSNAFILRLDATLAAESMDTYHSSQNYNLVDVIKINSEQINLIGIGATYKSMSELKTKRNARPYYSLVNREGEIVFLNKGF